MNENIQEYTIHVFGKDYVFYLPFRLLRERLLVFERKHIGKVEFEIFNDSFIVVHKKNGGTL